MKTKLILFFLILVSCFGAIAVNPTEIIKTVASTTVPEQLSTSDIRFRTIVFIGNKAARTVNTGKVWLQLNPTNDVGAIPLLSGQVISVTVESHGMSVNDWWIDVETANDGVVAVLIP